MRMHDVYGRYLSTPTVQVVRDAILHSLLGHLSQCAGWIEKICVEKRWRWRLHELSGSLADNSSAASCSSQPLESVQTWHLVILPDSSVLLEAQNNRTNEVANNRNNAAVENGRPQRNNEIKEKPAIQGAKTTALDSLQREKVATWQQNQVNLKR